MKIKDGYLLREVAGSNIVVPVGEGSMDFSGVITLNDVGAFLWKGLENDNTQDGLLSALLGEYDVDETTARADIADFVDSLKGAGLLE
jgi:hypothetical protein